MIIELVKRVVLKCCYFFPNNFEFYAFKKDFNIKISVMKYEKKKKMLKKIYIFVA